MRIALHVFAVLHYQCFGDLVSHVLFSTAEVLDLASNNLNGSIPDDIVLLTNLSKSSCYARMFLMECVCIDASLLLYDRVARFVGQQRIWKYPGKHWTADKSR